MTDYREVNHGFDMLNRLFNPVVKPLLDELDKHIPHVGTQALEIFHREWKQIRDNTSQLPKRGRARRKQVSGSPN